MKSSFMQHATKYMKSEGVRSNKINVCVAIGTKTVPLWGKGFHESRTGEAEPQKGQISGNRMKKKKRSFRAVKILCMTL